MENVELPNGLQSITFGFGFSHSLENVALPSGLQSITSGKRFKPNMKNVMLPSGLQSIAFSHGATRARTCDADEWCAQG